MMDTATLTASDRKGRSAQQEATSAPSWTDEEQRALHIELMKIENQALYSDNNNRVTQRNYLLLGIFIVSSALLPLAIQDGVVHRQVALFYNIVVFFLMLLWGGNTDKMGEQNGEILQNEKKAHYRGVQTRRAARRKARRTIPLPGPVASLARMQVITMPHVLEVRWGSNTGEQSDWSCPLTCSPSTWQESPGTLSPSRRSPVRLPSHFSFAMKDQWRRGDSRRKHLQAARRIANTPL